MNIVLLYYIDQKMERTMAHGVNPAGSLFFKTRFIGPQSRSLNYVLSMTALALLYWS